MEKTYFNNYAGVEDCDNALIAELKLAGIEHCILPIKSKSEVPTSIIGHLDPSGWGFQRAWTYWVCSGPGIPTKEAEQLHEYFGDVVRVDGDCGCPSPTKRFKGFGCGLYHVDTLEGLEALADMIKKIMARN